MESGYFYSKSTGLYVARGPLRIDARVIAAASQCGVKLHWDDEGRINNLDFLESVQLLKSFGATMMSVKEYWLIMAEVRAANEVELLTQLQSDRYAEWLNSVFENKESVIEDIEVINKEGKNTYSGKRKWVQMPYGHPGWFNTDEIDLDTGLPKRVELNREKHATTWKYWSFCDYDYVAAGVRGWVTSVGKPSLDLGIPIDARQPNLLIRECRKAPLEESIDPDITKKAEILISRFKNIVETGEYESFYKSRSEFLLFIKNYGYLFSRSQETKIYKIREKLVEIAGLITLLARKEDKSEEFLEIQDIARKSWGIDSDITYEDFATFVMTSRQRLEEALCKTYPIVFVIGHKNPDTDAVVSCLFEAYRNHIADGKRVVFVPVVEGYKMPLEISRLLGEKLTARIVFTGEKLYQNILHLGQARWIMTDHSLNPLIQKFVISIVDHHIPSAIALRQEIPKTIEFIGSTSALIVERIYGLGLTIPGDLARILYGATLMDTENRSPYKMTQRDVLIMDDLKNIAEVQSDGEFFHDLMSKLLNSDDAEDLFARDYKEDWQFFGFAVAKVKHFFDSRGSVLKPELADNLVKLAHRNNADKNLPLTLIKLVDYLDDNSTINRERVYLIFNENIFREFNETMFTLLKTIIHSTFKGKESMSVTREYIEFWGVGDQLSRKRVVPLFDPVATAFNRFFFSPASGLYAKREFLKNTKRVRDAALSLGIKLSSDNQERINHVTYGEAIRLLDELGFEAMSLPEYWNVYNDAKSVSDNQMLGQLKSDGFVEFLHTIIEENNSLTHKPEIIRGKTSFVYEDSVVEIEYNYQGEKSEVKIPEGKPGLFSPSDVYPETGLPANVKSPNIYNDPTLWRYWSPDASINVATRGYIFLLGQPALDLKVHLSEAFQCLGIRPCCKKVELPEVEISANSSGVSLTIWEEGEKFSIREADLFKNLG
ncbi:MAG TPA: hypothetical protein VJC12_01290 [Candidatus Paceibacterota bacterium]